MRPILTHILGLPVYSYGFLLAIAFALGAYLASREAARRGIAADHVLNIALISAVSGVVGARLLFILLSIDYYRLHPAEILDFSAGIGGLSMHGGFILAILLGIWYCRHYDLNPWVMSDIVAPSAALGVGIVRIGCFLNGCCYGIAASPRFGLDCSFLHDTLRYPTQLYESGLDLLLFAYLFLNRNNKHSNGWVMLSFIGWYSVIRFVVEIFRDVPRVLGPISPAQLASVALAFGAFLWSARRDKQVRVQLKG